MIIENNQFSEQESNESLLTMKDLVLGERIKKVTTHEYDFYLCKVCFNWQPMIIGMWPNSSNQNHIITLCRRLTL